MAEVLSIDQVLDFTDKPASEDDVYFYFLPLAHDVRYLMEDVQALKPTIFCSVPRVFDHVYAGINSKISSRGALWSALFQAAPLPRHVEKFLRVTSGATLAQGYGLTESCGGCSTTIGNVFYIMGTVGVLMTTIEARLESVSKMRYDALSNEAARREICLRGSDIGGWQPNGDMKIIDRKKNIFKLSQGEYVVVENIENKYLRCPLIT
ncbi:eukaryotic long-chain fatty acid CoA synthetase (LC-FACS) [Stylosanthes scabra]|uniref:Eukaryotic long-chain fatty acid CoA synthetase (LC-FACS) n=1 Tax=Stylosanthes scabra TaxID=79078 RepID=A0ABU6Z6F0_9FABA|nr:eukaryotic long-chain fatty acid CoA synthetase (LC-FACS) [Stylosanthes scabra]